jgi:glutamyl/glutaminyl-tRNA synthetase
MQTQVRARIAPTPSGFLHLGNVFSFVLTWLIVRKNKGHLLLRIDDLDIQRRKIAYLDDIFSTLEWLGIDYDEGASGTSDFLQNFSQETRLANYEQLLQDLVKLSPPLVFECQCSRTDIQRNMTNSIYFDACRSLKITIDTIKNERQNKAWRIEVPNDNVTFQDFLKGQVRIPLAERMGDFIVRKKDGFPAYQIASLSDDLHYRINWIVRGEDLIDSTAAQVFLARLLGKSDFVNAQFVHHPLLLAPDHQKLSKSAGASSVYSLRREISSPVPILQWIGHQLAIYKKVERLEDLLAEFELNKLNYFVFSDLMK